MRNVQTDPSTAASPIATATLRPPGPDFDAWLARTRAEVDAALDEHFRGLVPQLASHSRLAAAVQYSVQVGGKRLRPVLVLESCRASGGRATDAMAAAVAIELVHTFSLIHDDLPAMDNDDLRRGQPTNHKVFGEGLAILAGDWLVTHAFAVLAAAPVAPEYVPRLVRVLAEGTERMIAGQAADIENERRPSDAAVVQYIHLHKTAALLETCCRLGALCARASEEPTAAMARYGRHLGLAFQIMDDLLDVTSSTEQLGKRARKDAAAAKQTYPAAFGLESSAVQARREVEAALAALEPFGSRADRLRELAWYVIQRRS